MPDIVAKVIADDGTESSFGPIIVSEDVAAQVIQTLLPHELARRQAAEESASADIVAAQEQRSADAAAANQAAIAATSEEQS